MDKSSAIEWLDKWKEPIFFRDPQVDGLEDIHGFIQEELRGETVTIEIEFDPVQMEKFEKYLSTFGWNFEEAANLYMMWQAFCPDRYKEWYIDTNKERIHGAIALYQQGNQLLGFCAAIAGLDKETFIKVLGKHHISIYAYGNEEEFMDELKNS